MLRIVYAIMAILLVVDRIPRDNMGKFFICVLSLSLIANTTIINSKCQMQWFFIYN